MQLFGWSFPFVRLFGVAVRINWTLLVVVVFGVVGFTRAGRVDLIWIPLLIPVVSLMIHAFAHIVMARLTGGRADATTLWCLGDTTAFDLPFRPGNHFAVGIAGPLASMVLWLVSELVVRSTASGWDWSQLTALPGNSVGASTGLTAIVAGYSSSFNFQIMILNLIPSVLFDGGRIWRALLWPAIGLRRAVRTTITLGFIASSICILWSVYETNFMLLLFGLIMLFASFNEHRAFAGGYDVVFEAEPGYATLRTGRPSWLSRWRERRRAAREQRDADEQAREQELLDRLLAKVSEHGLPALSEQERDTLQAISRKQKERVRDLA